MLPTDENEQYFNISIFSLIPDSKMLFSVYRKEKNTFILIVENGDLFPKNLTALIKDPTQIYIRIQDKQNYYAYLEKALGIITKNSLMPLDDKSKLIYYTSSRIINELFEKPESKETIERSKSLVDNTINLILSDEGSIKSMMTIGSHDYYTYTHSVDVAVFSIGFANYLKFSHADISNIGNGAMMHDIGKSKIPSEIINKQGKLSDDEFTIMKKHPIYSYDILQYHGETNEDILRPARNHHEKAGGNGYPDKLTASQMHTFAKIVTISDIFSALTTQRSYKKAFTSFEALHLIKTQMIGDLDKTLLMEFIKFMSKSSR